MAAMAATRDPIVLLHALGMAPSVWEPVRARLEADHDVLALATLGHRGGAPPTRRPVTVAATVDEAERLLDEHGLDRPHVVGNSLGGWMAIELARRGRARSVCAFSPAGCWVSGTAEQTRGAGKIRRARTMARLSRPLPFLLRAGAVRRLAVRDVAEHGERLGVAAVRSASADLLACTVIDDVLATDEALAPLGPLPCPVTVAWASADRITPLATNGATARERLPEAHFVVLDGVGHVPMLDAPDLVADTILAAVAPDRSHQA
jgi:pimeloyl-ACP methyl ester carboxylesterase